MILLAIFLVPLAFASTTQIPPSSSDDAATIGACLAVVVPAFRSRRRVRFADELVVSLTVKKSTGLLNASQLRGELHGADWSIFEDPFVSLSVRSATMEELPVPLAPTLMIEAVKEIPKDLYSVITVELWAPGYSSDGKLAVVRGVIGPSAHGTAITCALEKENSSWRILKHWISVFV